MSESMSAGTAKKRAKERDNHKCQFCGVTNKQHKEEYGTGVHAHHIIKDGDGGADDPKNLITVCQDCHTILERTQAEALSRIKEEETHIEKVTELKERVAELEARNSELESNKVDTPVQIFSWLENGSVRVHTLLKGGINPEVELYQDREKATQAYLEYDGTAHLQTHTVNVNHMLVDGLKAESKAEIELMAHSNGGTYFNDFVEASEFTSGEIPTELRGYRNE